MMKKALSSMLILLIAGLTMIYPSTIQAREISKAGAVFQQVKDGVVTIFTSAGHGSGFLIDDSGLIVTNSHVVNESSGHLRVKFGPDQIVTGKLIENDRENDVAIIHVNLENIKNHTTLKPFTPEGNEPLVLVGEEVIAIGTPIERETQEHTMTTGIVGKYDEFVISHDAAINHGNSGGPLLNFDGQVVGLNTFKRPGMEGVSGAVPITKAQRIIEQAKQKIAKSDKPSPELLPDLPKIPFPISQLMIEKPDVFPQRSVWAYNFSSYYFNVSTLTPPQYYRQTMKLQDIALKNRKKRAKKKGFEVTDDEYNYKNYKYFDYRKPLVTFSVMPKPKLTTGSKVFNTLSFIMAAGATAATFGATAPTMVMPFIMGKKEIKKDFLSMSLQTAQGKTICIPVESGRKKYEENWALITGYTYQSILDKSYTGEYAYDSHCFETSEPLQLVIDIEGTKDDDYTIKIPESVKKVILEDFKPYHEYVSSLQKTPAVVDKKPGNLTEETSTTKSAEDQSKSTEVPDYLKKYY
jgi:hypothetical protein